MITFILNIISDWKIFKKMGREGWESLVPIYRTYIIYDVLYGNGWFMFKLLLPFYNIYVYIRQKIDFCHNFNKKTGFIWGYIFVPSIFSLLLGLGDAVWKDGSESNTKKDFTFRIVTGPSKED